MIKLMDRIKYEKPLDITGMGSFSLKPGQRVVRQFTSTTSFALGISTVEGIYSLVVIPTALVASPTNANWLFKPNDLEYTGEFNLANHAGSTLNHSASNNNYNNMPIGYGGLVFMEARISTYTTMKLLTVHARSRANNLTPHQDMGTCVWNDTDTVWSSLGTLVLPNATSGLAYIERIR